MTTNDPGLDPKCANYHFGIWMIEPEWFKSAVSAVRDGIWPTQAAMVQDEEKPKPIGYVVRKGMAIVPIAGPMMKARSKYGGTSTVDVRTSIRRAVADDSVTSILILIDSPGGTVAGTESLAQDIANADLRKPTYAHIEDLGASAAYYAASQARRITASPTSLIGSLGTMMMLDDFSKNYELKGVKTYVVSSGGMKGAGAEGTEVTKEQLSYFQGLVDAGTEHFKAAVKRGREMSDKKVDALFDGRVHDAAQAKVLGLIDDVKSLDSAMTEIFAEIDDEDHPPIQRTKQTAIDLIKNATRLGTVAMNPDELLASMSSVTQITNQAPPIPLESEVAPAVTKENSAMADTPISSPPAQIPAAATTGVSQGITSQEISRLNEQARQSNIENGRKLGIEEGRAMEFVRFQKLVEAAPGKPELVIEAYAKRQEPGALALAVKASQDTSAVFSNTIQELQLENARWQALYASGGHTGVSMGVKTEDTAPQFDLEPEARAKMEWDSNPNLRAQHQNNERAYTLYRVNQLKGNVRILKSA